MESNSSNARSGALVSLYRNFRFGLRLCLRFPASTIMAVLVLSMGVGISTTMYTIATGMVNGIGGAEVDESYLWAEWETGQSWSRRLNTHDFKVFREGMESVDEVVGIQDSSFWVSLPALEKEGKSYEGLIASPRVLEIAQGRPILGTLFSDTAVEPGREPEILISESVWMRFFDRSEEVIGSDLMLGDTRARVVGVMPASFGFPANKHIWMASDWREYDGARRTDTPLISMVARLKPEFSIEQARAEMATIAGSLASQFPDTNRENTQMRVETVRERFLDDDSAVLITLMVVGAMPVLILACVNVFNIIIGRTAKRSHELAVRFSLGAKRSNVIWQVLFDGILLAGLGATMGLALASLGLGYVTEALRGFDVPALLTFELETRVIVFAVGVALVAGLTSSFIPAWRASGIDAYAIMKDESTSSTSIYIGWLSKVAVVSQVVFSGILLFMSIIFLMPSMFFNSIELPYDEDEVLTAAAQFWTDSKFHGPEQMDPFYYSVKESLMGEPGVEAVSMSSAAFGLVGNPFPFDFEGEDQDDQLSSDLTQVISVMPDFLEVYGVEPTSGRMINQFDTKDAMQVCVVNTNFVNTHCQHRDPLGMRIRLNRGREDEKWLTIVGVIPSLKPADIGGSQEDADKAFSEVLVPFAQEPSWNPTLLVRSSNAKRPELRQALRRAVSNTAPLVRMPGSIMTVGERLDSVTRIFDAVSMGAKVFGASALAMSLIGLYSIVAFATSQRKKEFGIRMAIGSTAWGVARAVLKPWSVMIGLGLVVCALAMFSLLTLYLYFVVTQNNGSAEWGEFLDPALWTAGILVVASFLAMALPAWRATKIEPMSVIRSE